MRLSTNARKRLPRSDFALPAKAAYPIPDASHARNALARVSQHGTPDEKATVRHKVADKFPAIAQHPGSGRAHHPRDNVAY